MLFIVSVRSSNLTYSIKRLNPNGASVSNLQFMFCHNFAQEAIKAKSLCRLGGNLRRYARGGRNVSPLHNRDLHLGKKRAVYQIWLDSGKRIMLVRTLKSRVVEGERVKDVESEQNCVRKACFNALVWTKHCWFSGTVIKLVIPISHYIYIFIVL
jgi:hypothetical protein